MTEKRLVRGAGAVASRALISNTNRGRCILRNLDAESSSGKTREVCYQSSHTGGEPEGHCPEISLSAMVSSS